MAGPNGIEPKPTQPVPTTVVGSDASAQNAVPSPPVTTPSSGATGRLASTAAQAATSAGEPPSTNEDSLTSVVLERDRQLDGRLSEISQNIQPSKDGDPQAVKDAFEKRIDAKLRYIDAVDKYQQRHGKTPGAYAFQDYLQVIKAKGELVKAGEELISAQKAASTGNPHANSTPTRGEEGKKSTDMSPRGDNKRSRGLGAAGSSIAGSAAMGFTVSVGTAAVNAYMAAVESGATAEEAMQAAQTAAWNSLGRSALATGASAAFAYGANRVLGAPKTPIRGTIRGGAIGLVVGGGIVAVDSYTSYKKVQSGQLHPLDAADQRIAGIGATVGGVIGGTVGTVVPYAGTLGGAKYGADIGKGVASIFDSGPMSAFKKAMEPVTSEEKATVKAYDAMMENRRKGVKMDPWAETKILMAMHKYNERKLPDAIKAQTEAYQKA